LPKIEWAKDALDDLQKIDKPIVKRILKKVSWFSQHFDDITLEPLSGELEGTFKLRIGDWRVIYTIDNDVITIQAVWT
jgi:mRNA interferase RelE/StbE